jgi:hypothetical protein
VVWSIDGRRVVKMLTCCDGVMMLWVQAVDNKLVLQIFKYEQRGTPRLTFARGSATFWDSALLAEGDTFSEVTLPSSAARSSRLLCLRI